MSWDHPMTPHTRPPVSTDPVNQGPITRPQSAASDIFHRVHGILPHLARTIMVYGMVLIDPATKLTIYLSHGTNRL